MRADRTPSWRPSGQVEPRGARAPLRPEERAHATPQVDVRGGGCRDGRVLLVRHGLDDGAWTFPRCWAEVGENASRRPRRRSGEEAGTVRGARVEAVAVSTATCAARPRPPAPRRCKPDDVRPAERRMGGRTDREPSRRPARRARACRRPPLGFPARRSPGPEGVRRISAATRQAARRAHRSDREVRSTQWTASSSPISSPATRIPLAVKDLFDTAGLATTYGSIVFVDHVPTRDGRGGRAARGGRLRERRQGEPPRVRLRDDLREPALRHGAEPARAGTDRRRLERRLAPRPRCRPRRRGARHRLGRLDPDPGGLLRHRRLQADLRARPARGLLPAGAELRPRRADGARRRRRARA